MRHYFSFGCVAMLLLGLLFGCSGASSHREPATESAIKAAKLVISGKEEEVRGSLPSSSADAVMAVRSKLLKGDGRLHSSFRWQEEQDGDRRYEFWYEIEVANDVTKWTTLSAQIVVSVTPQSKDEWRVNNVAMQASNLDVFPYQAGCGSIPAADVVEACKLFEATVKGDMSVANSLIKNDTVRRRAEVLIPEYIQKKTNNGNLHTEITRDRRGNETRYAIYYVQPEADRTIDMGYLRADVVRSSKGATYTGFDIYPRDGSLIFERL